MANLLDDEQVALVCDHCGEETYEKVGLLKLNRTVVCLACGVSLEYEAAKFRRGGTRSQNSGGDSTEILA